jgi:hypothetical protein
VEDFSHASGIIDWVVDPDVTVYAGPTSAMTLPLNASES